MSTFREKFQDLHQQLSNCRNELVLVRLAIGKEIRASGKVSSHLCDEEKRLLFSEIDLKRQLQDIHQRCDC